LRRLVLVERIYFWGATMIKTKLVSIGVCAVGLLLVSGCAMTEKKEEKSAQAMPINCKQAPGDLRVLNSEKASTASKIGNGISMIAPIGLVEGLVTGTEETKYQVTTGEYNKALDTKIAQIKAACPGAQAD
jgi:outer membrane murein-binding lipoprotein Lpp